ncbi:MAG: dihydroorotase [Clostridia bacterium]|nr:dihydroorotase [Clostridia bacterium]
MKDGVKREDLLTVLISGDLISDEFLSLLPVREGARYAVFPGFCDVHVHFREPGFSYKETIASGTRAAARGGYTTVMTMPNLDPVPDSLPHLEEELAIIRRDAVIETIPLGALTIGERGEELADLQGMAPYVGAFSDDGKGVQSEEMMRRAMKETKRLGRILAAHCEDEALVNHGVIHAGRYAADTGLPGILSESEWKPIERDLALARETGAAYHVCHVSTKESVELIRRAKKEGADVTCETAPHYLLLDEGDLRDEGRFKMNPPLRGKDDREALIEGLLDGTIDMIATDHAPHGREEKDRGLLGSPFGVVGIETAFPLLYTGLVEGGILSLERLAALLTKKPRERFGIPEKRDFTVWDLAWRGTVRPEEFLSRGRATPFEGWEITGKCMLTVSEGRVVYRDGMR